MSNSASRYDIEKFNGSNDFFSMKNKDASPPRKSKFKGGVKRGTKR